MPTPSPVNLRPSPLRPRRLALVAAGLVLLIVASAALNVHASRAGVDAGVTGMALTALNNLEFLCAFPGYFIAWKLGHYRGPPTWGSSLLGAAIGWPMFFVGLWLAWSTLRAMVMRVTRRPAEPTLPGVQVQSPELADAAPVSRRRVIAAATFGVPALIAPGAAAYATLVEPLNLRIRRYAVPIRGLPERLNGLRVVQLSDTHFGPRVPAAHIAAAVDAAIRLAPDLYVLTGDYVYDGAGYIPGAADLFRPLTRGPGARPTLATLGNHDWYADGPGCAASLSAIGVRMIDNAGLFLDADSRELTDHQTPGRSLCIAGLGDLLEDHIDPQAALGSVHPDIPRLVLAHNPDSAEDARVVRGPRIDLMLSGHTHGGQCRFPFIGTPITLSAFGQKYNGGIAMAPTCRVLVSRGIGTSILPIRFGVPPEVVEITLTRKPG